MTFIRIRRWRPVGAGRSPGKTGFFKFIVLFAVFAATMFYFGVDVRGAIDAAGIPDMVSRVTGFFSSLFGGSAE